MAGENITELLKAILDSKGMNQKDLAAKMGTYEQKVSRIINSKRLLVSDIQWICNALNVSLAELLIGNQEISDFHNISKACVALAREIDKLDPVIKNKFLLHIESGLDLIRS